MVEQQEQRCRGAGTEEVQRCTSAVVHHHRCKCKCAVMQVQRLCRCRTGSRCKVPRCRVGVEELRCRC